MRAGFTFENDSQLYALGTTAGSIRIDHRRDEMLEGGGGVAATAGVHRRGLDDCAARSDEPVKTLTLR